MCGDNSYAVPHAEKWGGGTVGASSVNMFKNKIDIYLRRAGYI